MIDITVMGLLNGGCLKVIGRGYFLTLFEGDLEYLVSVLCKSPYPDFLYLRSLLLVEGKIIQLV